MTIVGGNIEQKTIGVKIGTDGTFINTVINNGNVELSTIGDTDVYHKEGEWISKAIDIGDNFNSFGKVFVTNVNHGNSNIEVLTRTSDDNATFDAWVKVDDNNDIKSIKRRYISIKVIFHVGTSQVDNYISRFDSETNVNDFYNNEFINVNDGLDLKREYTNTMTLDTSWPGVGKLYRNSIMRNEWVRLDILNIT